MILHSSVRNWLSHRGATWCAVLAWSGAAWPGNLHAQTCTSLAGVIDLGTNVASMVRGGQVFQAQGWNVYRLTISTSVRALSASVPSSVVSLTLFRDDNNNALLDQGDTQFTACGPNAIGCSSGPSIVEWLNPGTYYLGVCPVRGDASYQLMVSTTAHPESLGDGDDTLNAGVRPITPGQPLDDYVGIFDLADYFQFAVTDQVAEVTATLPYAFLTGGNPTLSLFPHSNNQQIYISDTVFGGDASVSLWLDRGTYYLKVDNTGAFGTQSDIMFRLNLTQTPKVFSPGTNDNDWHTARLLLPHSPTNDFVGISDPVDYYKVIVVQAATIEARIPYTSPLSADVHLTLLQEGPGGVLEMLADDIGTPAFGFSKDAVVTRAVAAGTYYLQVAQGDPNDNRDSTTYFLSVNAPEPPLPSIQLSGDLAFGDVRVNTSATRTLTISNSGTAVLNVSGITYPEGFSGAFSGTIPASDSTNVTVTFAPTNGTTYGGFLTVNSDAILGLGTKSVSGQGATRVISLSGSLAFGELEALQSSNRTLIIQNTGTAPLTITGISYPDGFSGDYSNGIIPAGGSVNVIVTFAPVANTNYGGTLVVSSDKTSGENTIEVFGLGNSVLARTIGLRGDLAFGLVEVGQQTNRMLVITNSGGASFTVSGISYSIDGFSGDFTGVIPPHQSRNVVITFSPSRDDTFSGLLTVNSPDSNGGTNTIEVSGRGTPLFLRTMNLIGDLNFGNLPARSSAMRKLIITNSGNDSFTVSSISYPPGFSGAFSGLVPAGGARTVMVTFTPTLPTNYSGLIIVNSPNWNGGTNSIQASGNGTPVALHPAAGLYAGLFHPLGSSLHDHDSSGYFTLNATMRGTYTAVILLSGKRQEVSGRFAFDGAATNNIKRAGKPTVTVVWHASPYDQDLVDVTVDGGLGNDPSVGEGHRSVYAALNRDAPQAGRYTLLLPAIFGGRGEPEGTGFGTVSVTKRGMATFSGRLADGTVLMQQSPISAGGDWPFYKSLYDGHGSVLGWLLFTNSPASDLTGEVSWFRPANARSKLYPDGFTVRCEAIGSRYVAPLANHRVVAITNGVLTLFGGELSQPLVIPVTLGANNKVTNHGTGKLTMTIIPSTGLFSGTATPRNSTTGIKFQGAILQRTNSLGYGDGYHTGNNLNGRVVFEAAE